MNAWLTLLTVGALLVPGVSLADDGDSCDADTGRITNGIWATVVCVNLCDGKAAADSTCTEWDFNSGGMPDVIILEREDVGADCTDAGGPTFTFTTGPTTGGSPSYVPDTSAVVLNDTTDRLVIVTKDATLSRYLFTAVSDDTTCTDVDVRMYLMSREDT